LNPFRILFGSHLLLHLTPADTSYEHRIFPVFANFVKNKASITAFSGTTIKVQSHISQPAPSIQKLNHFH